jgi:ribonuclease HI
MHVVARRGLDGVVRITGPLLAFAFVCLLAVKVPGVGVSVNGARRWLGAGPLQFQPSELMKLALVLYAAGVIAQRPKIVNKPKQLMPIGYATVIRIEDFVFEMSVWDPRGTNNTAELKAATIGLQALNVGACLAQGVTVHADSEYVIGQAMKKHKTNKNKELVEQLQVLCAERKAQFEHVRGHSGDWGNERCDVLAGHARKSSMRDPLRDPSAVVHSILYHIGDPKRPLLVKGTKEVCDVIAEGEHLRLSLMV